MNPVVHFEMPFDDRLRMAEFYKQVFNWNVQLLGPEMGDYVLAETSETSGGRPLHPGTINGGFYPRKEEWPAQHPSVVIAVGDILESMKQVSEAGGTVLGEPHEIPGIGLYVSFLDTENNRVSLLQPYMHD